MSSDVTFAVDGVEGRVQEVELDSVFACCSWCTGPLECRIRSDGTLTILCLRPDTGGKRCGAAWRVMNTGRIVLATNDDGRRAFAPAFAAPRLREMKATRVIRSDVLPGEHGGRSPWDGASAESLRSLAAYVNGRRAA